MRSIDQLVHQGQQNTPQLQMAVREELVNREILMQEALRRGLPNRPDIKAQIAVAQQTVVLRALIEDFVKNNTPTDAEVTARYNALIKDAGGKEYHLHHILVDNEAAGEGPDREDQGAARASKTSPSNTRRTRDRARTAATWTGRTRRPTCLNSRAAATQLQKGQMTDTPVHTQFGWHIIRVDDVRDVTPPPLEQVRAQIVQQIQQEKLQAFEEGLRKNAKIQ